MCFESHDWTMAKSLFGVLDGYFCLAGILRCLLVYPGCLCGSGVCLLSLAACLIAKTSHQAFFSECTFFLFFWRRTVKSSPGEGIHNTPWSHIVAHLYVQTS